MADSTFFRNYAAEVRPLINAALESYTSFGADCPAHLQEAIRYSLLGPGKKLRPLLVFMAAETCGSSREDALPAACAVEMIHAYSLIHDDLPAMDDDDMRRGRPSCHAKFGQATAILAGDALLTLAFEVLARHQQPPQTAALCCAHLAAAAGAEGMVGGQADDLNAEFSNGDLAMLKHIHRRKTGAMIRVSVLLGGLVGGANNEQTGRLVAYGEKLGLAFQIVDDLLDFQGDEAAVGKRTGKDSARGKLTFPTIMGAEKSRAEAAALIQAAREQISPWGVRAKGFDSLATFVLERNQ